MYSPSDRARAAWLAAGVMFLASGCGGGTLAVNGEADGGRADAAQGAAPAQFHAAQHVATTDAAPAQAVTGARGDTTSFTLNPTAQFKGFNHQIWNDNRSWYECDCGDKPRPLPKTMPWNTND